MNFLQRLDDATDKHIDLLMSGLSRSPMKNYRIFAAADPAPAHGTQSIKTR